MTTPTNPPISLENVRAELGVAYPISLNQSNVLQLAGKSGPPISLLDLLGKSNAPIVSDLATGHYNDGQNDWWGYDDGVFTGSSFGSLINSLGVGNIHSILTSANNHQTYFFCDLSYIDGKNITITNAANGDTQTGHVSYGGQTIGNIYIYLTVPYFPILNSYPVGTMFKVTAGN